MPNEPWLYAVAIAVGAIVLLFALWRGGVVEASLKPLSLKFKSRSEGGAGRTVSVLDRGTVTDAKVGGVAGIDAGGGMPEGEHSVDVAGKARISRSEVGDIVGIRTKGGETGQAGDR